MNGPNKAKGKGSLRYESASAQVQNLVLGAQERTRTFTVNPLLPS
jgi:hypothetical protein